MSVHSMFGRAIGLEKMKTDATVLIDESIDKVNKIAGRTNNLLYCLIFVTFLNALMCVLLAMFLNNRNCYENCSLR